jgi:hypothetical protein
MANCETCKAKQNPVSIPYVAHEKAMQRAERHTRRLWIALIVAVALIFASNVAWLWYESQFETITYQQEGEGINNVNYGEQGDLNNGAESENQAQAQE